MPWFLFCTLYGLPCNLVRLNRWSGGEVCEQARELLVYHSVFPRRSDCLLLATCWPTSCIVVSLVVLFNCYGDCPYCPLGGIMSFSFHYQHPFLAWFMVLLGLGLVFASAFMAYRV
eukprot:2583550-Amphidinium_carterae.2